MVYGLDFQFSESSGSGRRPTGRWPRGNSLRGGGQQQGDGHNGGQEDTGRAGGGRQAEDYDRYGNVGGGSRDRIQM